MKESNYPTHIFTDTFRNMRQLSTCNYDFLVDALITKQKIKIKIN